MIFQRPIRTLLFLAMSIVLTACHIHGHVPPGQVKKVLVPPPGLGDVPPGQAKKIPE